MKVYVLTVGNEERLNLIAKQLKNIDYELIYSESEEVLADFNDKLAKRQLQFSSRKLSLGEMGAWRIHVRAWEEVVKQEVPCLIFEDNAFIYPEVTEMLPQIMADIRDYGMISFTEHMKRSTSTSPYLVTKWHFGMHMYGITPFYADAILTRVEKLGYTFPVDSWLRRIKLAQIHVFSTPYKLAARMPRRMLGTYAQQNIPKKSYKITYVLKRIVNKVKYKI